MSILQTLYILFKGDTSDLKKKTEEVNDGSKKLTSNLEETNKVGNKLGESFAGIAKSFTDMLTAALTVGEAVSRIKGAADYAFNLKNTSETLGVNARELETWSIAAETAGGSAESFAGSLAAFRQATGTSGETTMKSLFLLADVFKNVGNFRANLYGKAVGMDPSLIRLLSLGSVEVKKLIDHINSLGETSKKSRDISNEFTSALIFNEAAWRHAFNNFDEQVLPILIKFLDTLTKIAIFFQQNTDLMVGAMIGIGVAATAMLVPLTLATVEFVLAAAAVIILIGLFALMYDDLQAWRRGSDSLIGRIINGWPKAAEAVKAAFKGIKAAIWEALEQMFPFLRVLDKINSLIGNLVDTEVKAMVTSGSAQLADANIGASALFSKWGGEYASYANHTTLHVGEVNLHTQATDAEGISKVFYGSMKDQLSQTNNYNADGRAI